MANNFKFKTDSVTDRIQLKLYGDFDGSSACELINFLKAFRNASNQISIDTNNLNTLHPFGLEVFKNKLGNIGINKKNISIFGKHQFGL